MPWSNQSGGGGWKGGNGGPWGPRPGGPGQQPDLEEILRRSQDRLRQAMPGGRMGGPFAVLLADDLVETVRSVLSLCSRRRAHQRHIQARAAWRNKLNRYLFR